MGVYRIRPEPALGLGLLGHCLGPTRESPKFWANFFYFSYKYFFKILKHFNLHFFFTIKKAQVMLEIEIRQI